MIELIPAEVIVRRDLREKLACAPCESELVRAPVGDKVVPSGKFGLMFVRHEKIRVRNRPPIVQIVAGNLSAWETLRGSSDPFLRDQARRSRDLALRSLPILRAIAKHPPSPGVLARIEDLEARARAAGGGVGVVGRAVGRLVEGLVDRKANVTDRLERPRATSDPPLRFTFFNLPGRPKAPAGVTWWERLKALGRVPEVPALTSGRLRELPAPVRRPALSEPAPAPAAPTSAT